MCRLIVVLDASPTLKRHDLTCGRHGLRQLRPEGLSACPLPRFRVGLASLLEQSQPPAGRATPPLRIIPLGRSIAGGTPRIAWPSGDGVRNGLG